jgi:hypothetical protein
LQKLVHSLGAGRAEAAATGGEWLAKQKVVFLMAEKMAKQKIVFKMEQPKIVFMIVGILDYCKKRSFIEL